MCSFDVFDFNVLSDFLHRHRAQFGAAKKICSQTLKMQAHETPHFARSFFVPERNR